MCGCYKMWGKVTNKSTKKHWQRYIYMWLKFNWGDEHYKAMWKVIWTTEGIEPEHTFTMKWRQNSIMVTFRWDFADTGGFQDRNRRQVYVTHCGPLYRWHLWDFHRETLPGCSVFQDSKLGPQTLALSCRRETSCYTWGDKYTATLSQNIQLKNSSTFSMNLG